MGRLIDADKLKADLEKAISKNEDMDCLDFLRVDSVIDAQPTAYDPDKVVEQLEEEVKEYDKRIERRNGDCYFDETEKIKALEERARGIERAIEIAKGGGVDGN